MIHSIHLKALLLFLVLGGQLIWAQAPTSAPTPVPGAPAANPPAVNNSPAVPAPPGSVSPPAMTANPGAAPVSPSPNPGPGNAADVPLLNFGSEMNFNNNLSKKDPFRLPEYILSKLRQKVAIAALPPPTPPPPPPPPPSPQNIIDDTVEPIRRWPLSTYQLVGIIWDVKKPKAMFSDRFNTIHVLQINDFIGNAKGVITAIQNGTVTVQEGKSPQIVKLKK